MTLTTPWMIRVGAGLQRVLYAGGVMATAETTAAWLRLAQHGVELLNSTATAAATAAATAVVVARNGTTTTIDTKPATLPPTRTKDNHTTNDSTDSAVNDWTRTSRTTSSERRSRAVAGGVDSFWEPPAAAAAAAAASRERGAPTTMVPPTTTNDDPAGGGAASSSSFLLHRPISTPSSSFSIIRPQQHAAVVEQSKSTSPPPPPPPPLLGSTTVVQPPPLRIANTIAATSTPHASVPVPTTQWARALGFAQLGVGLAWGTLAETTRKWINPTRRNSRPDNVIAPMAPPAATANNNPPQSTSTLTSTNSTRAAATAAAAGSVVVTMNDANADRIAATLCRMRGAALKLGQMLSIQSDESILPPTLARALAQVRQGAHAMPLYQLQQQLDQQWGGKTIEQMDWRQEYFTTFETTPFAAASIGQVHRATLRQPSPPPRHANQTIHTSSNTNLDVVVKVQYPGVAQSIESDLRNLSMLVQWSGLAPPGLFIENVIRVGQQELSVECDYRVEVQNQVRMKKLVESDSVLRDNRFIVPDVIPHLCTDQILVSEHVPGVSLDQMATVASQAERNRLGRTILYLTMQELFVWRFMQTDPNWGNFLYDVNTQRTGLIDFGASRSYSPSFVDGYLRIVWASANRDEITLLEQSRHMGFLTGDENAEMIRAHIQSGFTVGEPFAAATANDTTISPPETPGFDFCRSNISRRLGEHTAVFLKHRLTPPPEEVYTLHRKLAGAYMLCIQLGAIVPDGREMLETIVTQHEFHDGKANPITGELCKSSPIE